MRRVADAVVILVQRHEHHLVVETGRAPPEIVRSLDRIGCVRAQLGEGGSIKEAKHRICFSELLTGLLVANITFIRPSNFRSWAVKPSPGDDTRMFAWCSR